MHDFLKSKGVKMWMWGDRLINGEKTGLGRWEASMNDTYQAINMIPKDITISDWHYSVASPGTAAMFAAKGFNVVICPWRSPEVAYTQLENMIQARSAHSDVSKHMRGVLDTFWGNTSKFMDAFEGKKVSNRTLEAYKTFIKLSKNW